LFIICTFLCQITILSFFKGSRGTVIDQDWDLAVDRPRFRVFRKVSLDFCLLLVNRILDLSMTCGKCEEF
jgi:hypothetical protein